MTPPPRFNRMHGSHPMSGSDDTAQPVNDDPEVLPPMSQPARRGGDICVGPVRIDRSTTFDSPCFWLLGGLAAGMFIMWQITRKR